MLGTEAESGLVFSARADLNGAKTGGWGNINTTESGVMIAGSVGTLGGIAGSKAGVGENMLRYMAGMGTSDCTG